MARRACLDLGEKLARQLQRRGFHAGAVADVLPGCCDCHRSPSFAYPRHLTRHFGPGNGRSIEQAQCSPQVAT
jgi:hypothetical protein